jgi:branched-chain amino acid transport system permease protein
VQTIRTIIKDTLITGIIAFLVFGPITGVLLKGFEIELAMMRPLLLTLVVMAGRLLFLITP